MFKEFKGAQHWQQQREARRAPHSAVTADSVAAAAVVALFPFAYFFISFLGG